MTDSATPPLSVVARFSGVIAFEDIPTIDGRRLAEGALGPFTHPLEHPVLVIDAAHPDAILGEVTSIERLDGGAIWAKGDLWRWDGATKVHVAITVDGIEPEDGALATMTRARVRQVAFTDTPSWPDCLVMISPVEPSPKPLPPTRYAVVAGNGPLLLPAGDDVDDAMSEVINDHREAFDAALEPFGLTLDSLAQATWMRWVRLDEVQSYEPLRQVNANLEAARAGDEMDRADLEQEERDHVFDLPEEPGATT